MSFSGTLFLPPPWTSGELDWQLNSGPAHKQVNAQSEDEWPVTQRKDLQMRMLEDANEPESRSISRANQNLWVFFVFNFGCVRSWLQDLRYTMWDLLFQCTNSLSCGVWGQ